ncbi:helix-turn-helix transcriptional regulator [Goodfellowiella coeruleoviolacea]|uniref:Helix-turn-helix domain-containing protein n=1 Tax=Goodfellowiella coeruleoviolacea TaxID=334858 RepID=A0AAE3KE11_9PSEU|nr:helix-turn-helix transcriptional regulator [Goodfellowiella coeruleoviolacea]MCP2163402.1 Helix-turn-helix domain-containing protein [Goodfellowiella coeruleoviolacea]
MSTAAAQRRELGLFLRSRRARLTPADVGLPSTGRRRTPGLRREEIALVAGISATWYTYLEQGRDVRPSEQVLLALASALRLSPQERAHLLHLASSAPQPRRAEPERLAPEVAAIPLLLSANPAYLTGANHDVLSHNPAAAELFPDLDAPTGGRPNVARWVFTAPSARQVLVDWEREAQGLLARLRAAAGRHPGDPRFTSLIEELHAASPEVRAWWPRYDIQVSRGGAKRLRHPRLGLVTLTHTAFHLADQPEQTLVIYSDPAGSGPAPA